MSEKNKAQGLLDRYEKAKTHRSRYDGTLEEVGKYVWPIMQDMVRTTHVENEGQVRTVDIYDSTAIVAAEKMTSGIFSYLMPVGARWFEFVDRDSETDTEIKATLSRATDQVHQEIWRSNFQREMFTTIRSLCVFGTGAISTELYNDELLYRTYHLGTLFFEENSKGIIDTVFRQLFYTPRQAAQEFGEENISDKLRKKLGDESCNERYEFIHSVYPNGDYGRKQYGDMKFKSVYIEKDEKKVVKEKGFEEIPYLVARFAKAPGEIMGRCPGIEMLPEIKMLNAMKRTFIESSELAAMPPIMLEDDGVIGQPSVGPGSAIYYRPGSHPPQPYPTGVNPQLNHEVIVAQQQIVREAFYNDLFNALSNYRNMTATEVVERVEEKMVMLSPAVSALQKELFDPLIMRTLRLLQDSGVVEEFPDGLNLKIVYQGRLALAMNNMQTNAIEATLAKWTPYMEAVPILDNMDVDKAFRLSALNAGVPADVIRKEKDVQADRQERKAKEEAAFGAQIGETASKAYKNAKEAADPRSLAGSMMNAL